MANKINVALEKKEQIKEDIFKFSFISKEIANESKPGQFLEIQVSKSFDPILRRPISIYNVEKESGLVEFIF